MKYLHIMPPSQRMMRGYLMMLRKYFDIKDHTILYNRPAAGKDLGMLLFDNTINTPALGKNKLQKYRSYKKLFSEAEHIVFHQFCPSNSLLLYLFLHREVLKKSIWVIWGIDLYNYKYKSKKLKARILNYLGHACRDAIGVPVVLLPTDLDVYRKEFGDRRIMCAPYDTSDEIWESLDNALVLKEERRGAEDAKWEKKVNEALEEGVEPPPPIERPLRVLVGHNAHPFNRHKMILNLLQRFNSEKIRVCLPLSYGNDGAESVKNYPRIVNEYANILFPGKVEPSWKLKSKWDYDKFLAYIDVAIFGAPRQNALGNILRLVYMGKKVYLAEDNPLFSYLRDKGVPIQSINDLKTISFEEFAKPLDPSEFNNWVKDYYCTEHAAECWKEVFEYAESLD